MKITEFMILIEKYPVITGLIVAGVIWIIRTIFANVEKKKYDDRYRKQAKKLIIGLQYIFEVFYKLSISNESCAKIIYSRVH